MGNHHISDLSLYSQIGLSNLKFDTMPLALHLARNARQNVVSNPVAKLYRAVMKEVPRVLTIYDIDIPLPKARNSVRTWFQENSSVKDPRVIDMLIEKGYMNLEETLLQYKQRSHLIRNFNGYIELTGANRKRLGPESTIDEQFARGY